MVKYENDKIVEENRKVADQLDDVVEKLTDGKYTTLPTIDNSIPQTISMRVMKAPIRSFPGYFANLYYKLASKLRIDVVGYINSGKKELPIEVLNSKYGCLAQKIKEAMLENDDKNIQ